MVAHPTTSLPASARTTHVSFDGIAIATQRWAGTRSPSLVFAHGFGQTRHAWSGAARALAADGFDTLTYDARGHGESERVPRGDYHLEQFVADLLMVAGEATTTDGRAPVLVGASMGGLLGLVAAGEAEGRAPFSALVLVDITPRWETAGVERILGFMRAYPDGFASYDEAASVIEAYLPHRRERKTEAQLKPLLRQDTDGRLRWHWDPAMLNAIATGSAQHQPRLLAAATQVRVPVLLVSGGRSDVVSKDTVAEFINLVPHAIHVDLPQATHMVAGDANDAFTSEIASFISGLSIRSGQFPG
jgi:pimeloyl-ACP methyl ester carboxylesterase